MSAATQNQLAKTLGVSRSTIAAALNPNSPIKLRASTKERILQEAARLNYRPAQHAKILRGGKSGLIGLIHFGGLSQVAAERAWHASSAIHQAGYRVLFNDNSWSPGDAKAACESMLDARVEGVIVAGLNDPDSVAELEALQKTRTPIVTLSGNELGDAPHIRGDATDAMYRLTKHLLQLGRRRLLFLTHFSAQISPGSYLWAAQDRLEGFQAALKEASAKLVEQFSGGSTNGTQGRALYREIPYDPFDPFRAGKEAMLEVLRSEQLPDAVLCGNDDWAIGALAACREAGVRVPDDIAITGYDNNAAGAYLDIPLTTVSQPSRQMAERAVELMLDLINGKKTPKSSRLIKMPCDLVIRRSCGSVG